MSVALGVAIAALAFLTGLFLWRRRGMVPQPLEPKAEELARHLALYNTADPDADDREMKALRLEKYPELVENYYDLTTDIFHRIWGPHYSMGVLFPVEGGKWQKYPACQQMYQCYLGLSLGANETMTIGDFGCGTGGPSRTIAQFTGARIKAVNLNEMQLAQMQKWNEEEHIDHQIELVKADYHETPIESDSLDGVYMCESLAHSPDYGRLCKEVFRVLKPGARFTGFNWELTEKFDESNPEHRRIRHQIEYGVGVCQLVKMSELTEALKQAGFEIITQRDHSDFGVSLGGKKWWYMFEEGSRPVQILMDLVGKLLSLENMMWVAEKLRVVPPGTARAHDLMHSLGAGMKDGGEQGIFTPMHYWLARKPS